MATYLQGVTDYVPQIQPFQPDLNLYANVLQTKQTQYDTAWKALNNVYSQYFYSELTRDGNIKKKEELLKNIDFNLRRISGLDLSLDQNVSQATQVFKPFYEDNALMKDMAWTKNYNGQKGRAMSFKNSSEAARREQYWDAGVRELDYKREEFKTATDEEAMSFDNVSYTPYVNVTKKARELAKDAGLSIETVDFSPDGKWIVKTRNGENLVEPLSKLFEAELGSDPTVQDVYRSQAYVNRKDYAYSNAAQFNGDKNAAEMKYLENNFNVLKEKQVQRYEAMQEQSTVYDNKIKDIEEQIAKGDKSPSLQRALSELKQGRDINNKVLERVRTEVEDLEDRSKTPGTSGSFVNPFGDLKSLRYKVDNGVAGMLMEKDMNEAAQIFAYKDHKKDIQANPYAVNEQKHSFAMQEIASRNAGLARAAQIRNEGERKNNREKYLAENGYGYYDADGNFQMKQSLQSTFLSNKNDGNVTGEINLKKFAQMSTADMLNEKGLPYLQTTLDMFDRLQKSGKISQKEISKLLTGSYDKYMTIETFNKKLQANPDKYMRTLGWQNLRKLQMRANWWIKNNNQVKAVKDEISSYDKMSREFEQTAEHLKNVKSWYKESSKWVEQQLAISLPAELKWAAKYAYDENGNFRSRAEFNKLTGIGQERWYRVPGRSDGRIIRYDETGQLYSMTESQAKKKDITVVNLKPGQEVPRQAPTKLWVDKSNNVYDQIQKAAAKAYSSTSTVKGLKAPPLVTAYGKLDPGTGLFTAGRSGIEVAPRAKGTPSYFYFNEFMGDLRSLDMGNIDKVKLSVAGTSKQGLSYSNAEKNRVLQSILEAAYSEMQDPKTNFKNFLLESQRIAGGDASKSAMVVHLDPLWLKKYVKTKDGTGGVLSQTQYENAVKHGISVVADDNMFNNSMLKSMDMTPLESNIEYNGYYERESLYGNGKYRIEKNPILGGYRETLTTRIEDPRSGKTYEGSETWNSNVKADIGYNNAMSGLDQLHQQFSNIGYGF